MGELLASGREQEQLICSTTPSTTTSRPDAWTCGTATDVDGVVLSVTNTGSWVPPGEIERLFEPFQRLARERTASDRHCGLGLSIVRAIATAHGGTVAAEPRPDGGLVVTVRLPGAG
jgi:signal transduction histidine kinase